MRILIDCYQCGKSFHWKSPPFSRLCPACRWGVTASPDARAANRQVYLDELKRRRQKEIVFGRFDPGTGVDEPR